MRTVYSVVLGTGILALIAWMVAHSLALSTDHPGRDPEQRFGAVGRRITGGLVGFGIAGMSAEFAAIDISPPLVLVAAVVGAGVAAWWAGAMGGSA